MKCGVITFHNAINYGALFQTYALQKALMKVGVDAEVIDYHSKYIERIYRPGLSDIFSRLFVKRLAAAIIKNGTLSFNNRDFAEFSDKYIKKSAASYTSLSELEETDYDLYITGSDQVWSPYSASFDKAYFLDFVKGSSKKVSYAASFGVDDIPSELKDEYRTLLCDFSRISVREKSGEKIVEELTGKSPSVLPDPTLLLSSDEWNELIQRDGEADGGYVLIYMIYEDNALINAAKKYAADRGLRILYINDRLKKASGVENLRNVSPERWLSLLSSAVCVFTNSYHGTAFCINLGKDFLVSAPPNQKTNTRLDSLTETYNIAYDEIISAEKNADLHEILASQRKLGYEFLKDITKKNFI